VQKIARETQLYVKQTTQKPIDEVKVAAPSNENPKPLNDSQTEEITEVYSVALDWTGPRVDTHTEQAVTFQDKRGELDPRSSHLLMQEMDKLNVGLPKPFWSRLIAAAGDDKFILFAVTRKRPSPLECPVPEPPQDPVGALIGFQGGKALWREVMDWLETVGEVVVEEVKKDAMTKGTQGIEVIDGAIVGGGEVEEEEEEEEKEEKGEHEQQQQEEEVQEEGFECIDGKLLLSF
jgi:hypothetical protein